MLLAGAPDSRRSAHTVPDDGVEATRVLWLKFHSLETLRELVLPAPHLLKTSRRGYCKRTQGDSSGWRWPTPHAAAPAAVAWAELVWAGRGHGHTQTSDVALH